MSDESRKQFATDELAILFRALHDSESECVLMGGQSVNFWANHYAAKEPALLEIQGLFPFVSKDADLQGGQAAAIALARALGSTAQVPTFRRAFGNLMAGQFKVRLGEHELKIEVLRKVPGLTDAELFRLTRRQQSGKCTIRVINPVGVLLAKTWNVANITQEGRHDAEQLLVMIPCVRAYIREFLESGQTDSRKLRAGLNLIKVTLAFTETKAAAIATSRCGIAWAQLLPHSHISASTQPELIQLRDKRIPDWLARVGSYSHPPSLNDSLRRILKILADHAQPLCATPAVVRRVSRTTHHASRRP
jgi:hypothetical protein